MSVLVMGIHTGVGKTVCSAILCEALGYHYWKPVQAGDLHASDSHVVRSCVGPHVRIYPEAFALPLAASPHYAALQAGVCIIPEALTPPAADRPLAIETAGGVMSPLGEGFTNIDLAARLGLPIVLVASDYLGSINHTLLSVAALRQRGLPLAGLVFSGVENPASRAYILAHAGAPLLFAVPPLARIDRASIVQASRALVIAPL